MISNYSPNRGRLEIQQQLIKELLNKPEDCRQITQLMNSIKKSEMIFYGFGKIILRKLKVI